MQNSSYSWYSIYNLYILQNKLDHLNPSFFFSLSFFLTISICRSFQVLLRNLIGRLPTYLPEIKDCYNLRIVDIHGAKITQKCNLTLAVSPTCHSNDNLRRPVCKKDLGLKNVPLRFLDAPPNPLHVFQLCTSHMSSDCLPLFLVMLWWSFELLAIILSELWINVYSRFGNIRSSHYYKVHNY